MCIDELKMSERTILEIENPVAEAGDVFEQQLVAKYSAGFLPEIVLACGAAIRTPVSTAAMAEAI
jgi:hypothetical protein